MGILKYIIKTVSKPVVNNMRGAIGESKVKSKLNPLVFGKVEHRQINNLILVDENNKSHQIDHIEIRENGIFCIETKNWKGIVLGSESQDKWTQNLYTEKHQLTNPLKQNKSHIYHISRVLDNKYHVNSLVVMTQNNANRIGCPNVINLRNLASYLKNYDDGTRLSIEEMEEVYIKLKSAASEITNVQHIKNIRKTQSDLKKGICPICGGTLVQRKGPYGDFLGCSNYPKCKFVLKEK